MIISYYTPILFGALEFVLNIQKYKWLGKWFREKSEKIQNKISFGFRVRRARIKMNSVQFTN